MNTLQVRQKFHQRGFGQSPLIQAGFTLNFNFQDLAGFITIHVHLLSFLAKFYQPKCLLLCI